MAEVTNGQLQMSAQEIQNNLEQVNANKTAISNIGNRLLALIEQTVQYIRPTDPNKARQYRNSGIKQSVVLGDALILATPSYYFYILDSQTIKEYRFDDSFYERTICSFNNAVIDDVLTGLKIKSINQPTNMVVIEPGLYTSMAIIEDNLTVRDKITTKDLIITGEINGHLVDDFALKENVFSKEDTYDRETINGLVKSHGTCSLSSIVYREGEHTINSDGTETQIYTIDPSKLSSKYAEMISYGPIILSFEGTGNYDLKFTTLVNSNMTNPYIWQSFGSSTYKVVFDITTASLIITEVEGKLEALSVQDLPTAITFKYL